MAEAKQDRATAVVGALTGALGSLPAIVGSFVVIVVWALTGPIFGFTDTWQLMVNTATTIITFNMVFVIQNTQNRDGRAIQTKLDAILEALQKTDNGLVGIEDLSESEIKDEQDRVRANAA